MKISAQLSNGFHERQTTGTETDLRHSKVTAVYDPKYSAGDR